RFDPGHRYFCSVSTTELDWPTLFSVRPVFCQSGGPRGFAELRGRHSSWPRLLTFAPRSPWRAWSASSATTSRRRTGGTTPTGSNSRSTAHAARPHGCTKRPARLHSPGMLNTSYVGRSLPTTEPAVLTAESVTRFARALGMGDTTAVPPTYLISLTLPAADPLIGDPEFGLDFSRVLHREQRFA